MFAYWRERLPLRVYLPVATALALAAQNERPDAISFTGDVALALLLVAQTRLWDDLADRRADRVRHPDRVLVRAATVVPFAFTCLLLGIAAHRIVLARSNGVTASLILDLLYLALAARYGLRRQRTALTELIVLAKYPAFVAIVANGRLSPSVMAGAACVFVTACVYEMWHDEDSALRRIVRLQPDTTPDGVRWP